MATQVGINYPWVNYDWDFGEPPRGSDGKPWGVRAAWKAQLAADLKSFRDLGIFAVRWWILGSGLAYGTGGEAPSRGPSGWTVPAVPALPQAVVDDFSAAMRVFREANMRLVPVFTDFHMFLDAPASSGTGAGFVKGGRQQLIADATKRPLFLQRALKPLLAAAQGFAAHIYAFEVVNEPEWCVRNPGSGVPRASSPTVDLAAMLAFLRDAVAMINGAGFKSTVGFAHRNTVEAWRSIELEVQIHQFHYYGDPATIPLHTFNPNRPLVVGEFASALHKGWPELAALERSDPGHIVLNRLKHLAGKGYPAAFIWSAERKPSTEPGQPPVVAWMPATQRDIKTFTGRT